MPKMLEKISLRLKEKIEVEKPLICKPLINIKNFDDANTISKVVIDRGSIVIGTQSGMILLFDRRTLRKVSEYKAHERKVTDIWL